MCKNVPYLIEGRRNLTDSYLQLREKNSATTPPPHVPPSERGPHMKITAGQFLLIPPPHPPRLRTCSVFRLWRSRKISATIPPPPTESGWLLEITQNLPGGIGRVPTPKQKSWLHRLMYKHVLLRQIIGVRH